MAAALTNGKEQTRGLFWWQGIGIEETLEMIVKRIPAPQDTAKKPLRALIFDSHYDSYKVHALAHHQKAFVCPLCATLQTRWKAH